MFMKYFHDKSWCYFHDILEFKWYRKFDFEEWCDRTYLDLKMTDITNKDTVLFRLIDASSSGPCMLNGWISGLDIINLRQNGTWLEHQYELIDYEDSGIHFYCKEIEIKVITVDGKDVSD